MLYGKLSDYMVPVLNGVAASTSVEDLTLLGKLIDELCITCFIAMTTVIDIFYPV